MGLVVLSNSAMALWINIDSNDDFITYADLDTIRKNGHQVKMWDMKDYKKVQISSNNNMYFSSMNQKEYNCKEEEYRILAFSLYSGNMGKGENVNYETIPDRKWSAIPSESIVARLLKIVCGKL